MAGKRNQKSNIQASSISWLEQLSAEVNIPLAPEGWFTMAQICEKVQRDHQVMRKILKEKNAEVKKFKHLRSDGKTFVTNHYKL